MANQQLVDYIKQQLQLGGSKDSVKSALIGAGWPEADVNDAMNTIGGAAPVASVAPAQTFAPSNPSAAISKPAAITSDIFQSKTNEPVFQPGKKEIAESSARPTSTTTPSATGRTFHKIVPIAIMAVVIVLLVVAAGLLYKQKSDLDSQVAKLTTDGATLATQAAALTKSKNDLTSQVVGLIAERDGLASDLSIFQTQGTSTEPVSVTVKGTVGGGGKLLYTLTTGRNIIVNVKNSKDAKVDIALKPVIGGSAEISGTHVPGSRDITVTAVNGQAL